MALQTVNIDELIARLTEIRDKDPSATEVVFRFYSDNETWYARDCYLVHEDIMCVPCEEEDEDIVYDDEDYFKEIYPDREWNPTEYIVFDID